ncbi:MAG: putative ADP-ribosylglycohydrolase [bacterium]|nr:MAG: putative ADP-ribosylglycohydrolase [bacterium]
MIKKYEGCLIGLAIGDALGAPVEGLTLRDIRERYGINGLSDFDEFRGFKEGFYTDDTQMSLATAAGLIDAENSREDIGYCDYTSEIYKRYLEWHESQADPEFRRGPGNTCLTALGSGIMGAPDKRINDSKGCGGVMRAAPAGLAFPPKKAFDEGVRLAAITHGHPSGYLPAGFFAEMIANIIRGRMPDEAAATAGKILIEHEQHEETLEKIDLAIELAESQHTVEFSINKLGRGWTGEEALSISLYCSLLYFDDWGKGVLASVNHSGDSDSTGSITGAILGTLLGVEKIPARWVHDVENSVMIKQIAGEMYRLFGQK